MAADIPHNAHTTLSTRMNLVLGTAIVLAFAGSLLFPPAAFSIDEAIYIDMAHAMASRGALDITPQNMPADAPVLPKSDNLVKVIDGRAIPQYPALYGVIAGPFFLVLGVKGLALLNALAALVSLILTRMIARRIGCDAWTANVATALLGGGSIFAGYVFAIWPHMLSLAFAMAGAYATLRATQDAGRSRFVAAFLAGLAFSLGTGIRVDVILSAVASFFWLRIFAAPSDRNVALMLLGGLIPGLLIAAALNEIKFGVFNPIFYGENAGAANTSRYATLALGAGAAGLAALILDISSPFLSRVIEKIRTAPKILFALGSIIVLTGLHLLFPRLFYGLYILLVDIQAFDGTPRPGLEKTDAGYWDFWGVPKKALLQSMPFLPLVIAPVVTFFIGKKTKELSFLVLFCAAPIAFFSMSAWHGGMAYNMRYFLPAIPFLTTASAIGLNALRPALQANDRIALFGSAIGAIGAMGLYAIMADNAGTTGPFWQLYPQLILALGLGAALIAVIGFDKAATPAAIIAILALAYGATLSFMDAYGSLANRSRNAAYAEAYALKIDPSGVVISGYDDFMSNASLNGTAVVRINDEMTPGHQALIDAYRRENRCVYAHTRRAALALGIERFSPVALPSDIEFGNLGLYVLKESPVTCR